MRLLLPRRRRGRGLGGLIRPAGAALVAALLLAVVGLIVVVGRDGGEESPPSPSPSPTASPSPVPVREPALAVGITEPNPNFVRPGAVDPAAVRWRDALAKVHPAYYRLVVDWARLQPAAATPPNLDLAERGCARETPPCAQWAGLNDQLRALAARQKQGGWEALVVITDTPAWAAGPVGGCTEGGGGPRSAAVRGDALPAYRSLIERVLGAASKAGAQLRWWSPWNEPNHPFFFPQRTACRRDAPTRAVRAYVPLARALQQVLKADGGQHGLALGELAGARDRSPQSTSIGEFVAALPKDLVCAAGVWSQHAYIGGRDPVGLVTRALRARGCPRVPPIWITETGVGGADSRLSIARGIKSDAEGCRLLHARLVRWWKDPRVAAAFQYTVRDDPLFPTGLVSADLATGRPTLTEWQAWGARRRADDPAPRATCPPAPAATAPAR